LGGHKYLEICPFLLDFVIYLIVGSHSNPWWFPGFPCPLLLYPPFCFWVRHFYFSQIHKGFVNLAHFFKESVFCLVDSVNGFLLCFVDFFPFYFFCSLHVLGLACSCFSRSLRCSFRSLISDLFVFLIHAFMAINFPLKTAFAMFHRF
jgi:hypothetical protein